MDNKQHKTDDAPRKRRKRKTHQRFYNSKYGQRLLDFCVERWGPDPANYPWPRVVAVLHADTEWRQWEAPEQYWRDRVDRAIRKARNVKPEDEQLRAHVRNMVKVLSGRLGGRQKDVAEWAQICRNKLSNKLNGYEPFGDGEIDRLVALADGRLPSSIDHPRILAAVRKYHVAEARQDHFASADGRVEVTKPERGAEPRPPFQPKPAAEQVPQKAGDGLVASMTRDPVIHAKICRILLHHCERQQPIDVEMLSTLAIILVDPANAADRLLVSFQHREFGQ